MTLRPGWNRLLVKVSSTNRPGWRSLRFAPRVFEAEPVYEEKNILWAAKLPERTNASPLVLGDRVFTPAEPDELVCLDKHRGTILWRRTNGYFDAIPAADRAANPAYRKIEPLAEKLAATTDYEAGLALRRQVHEQLLAAEPRKYKVKWDGHLASHFGIVGFTTTPVSDGRHVWAFLGQGIVACYDLEGNRRWIRRLESREIMYSCSPAVADGKLLVLFDGLHALDAATGQTVWSQPEVKSIASLIAGRFRGTDVVSTRDGRVFRVRDGKPLWSNPHISSGDTGWGPPVILGEVMYLHWLGIGNLIVADFSQVQGDSWKPKLRIIEAGAEHRRPNGEWLDRWTAGSPLVHEGLCYGIDQYGVFYAMDVKTDKAIYHHDVGFDELHHYNAIGVGASATLGGKHIYVVDNQGTCVVLAPGRQYRPIAVNRIETQLPRDWPIPPQEILSNAAPVFDGTRMYLRGEQYLYCIGER
jgi:outer membrane protein assembly factor BamB